jgi:hypothetical protein
VRLGGLFSRITQADGEVCHDFKVADGLLTRYEWRRDFSKRPSFFTEVQGVQQTTEYGHSGHDLVLAT